MPEEAPRKVFEPEVSYRLGQRCDGEVKLIDTPSIDSREDVPASQEYVPVVVTVETPPGEKRCPADIVVVIDISGSMGVQAKIKSADGSEVGHGLTLLDIAKHGVKTVIKTLSSEDRLSLVTFNHVGETIFGLIAMDEDGQSKAIEQLEKLDECGGTDIWAGLSLALDNLREGAPDAAGRLGHVMLLTDGQTNARDTVMRNLADYQQKYEHLPGTVSTFGFGYNIDSELLSQIAAFGDATYSFIPDAGFVGTVFINTLSNLLVTFARGVVVAVEVEAEDGSIIGTLGGSRASAIDNGARANIGTLQLGQSRSVVFCLQLRSALVAPDLHASVTYMVGGSAVKTTPPAEKGDPKDAAVEIEHFRCKYIDALEGCMHLAKGRSEASFEQAQQRLQSLAQAIEASPVREEPRALALIEDIKGQSSEAFSKFEWYQKWGRHYIPSVQFAHRVQQCNNFKDPSVQHYGGELFHNIRDEADDIFDKLPAPAPKERVSAYSGSTSRGGYGGGGHSPPRAAAVSMSAYNDRYGVCIDAASMARLVGTGGLRAVGDLRKGDRVAAPGGAVAEVVCVVRTACEGRRASLVTLPGGARVTPFHPVLLDGRWRFPIDIASAADCACDAVCSLLLSGAPGAVLVGPRGADESADGVAAIGLAHGVEDGAARHPYFGGPAVVKDLRAAKGFQAGLVELREGDIIRDPETGLVCGLAPS